MTQSEINFVNTQIYAMFLPIMGGDSIDSGNVADSITDEVVEDIIETADPNDWNTEDIRIAVARVIKKKLGVEE